MIALKPMWSGVVLGMASLSVPLATADAAGQADTQAVTATPPSADEHMTRIVSEYRRPMLDRGGWENPYLPSTGLGNALASASIGSGVTGGNELGSEAEAEGAASGEPDEAAEPAKK